MLSVGLVDVAGAAAVVVVDGFKKKSKSNVTVDSVKLSLVDDDVLAGDDHLYPPCPPYINLIELVKKDFIGKEKS